MKKFFSILLILVICLTTLGGCSSKYKKKLEEYMNGIEQHRIVAENLYYYDKVLEAIAIDSDDYTDWPTVFYDYINASPISNPSGIDERWQSARHITNKLESYLESSIAYPFLCIVSETQANPFSSFNSLVSQGVIKEDAEADNDPENIDFFFYYTYNNRKYALPSFPISHKKYEYSEEGCAEFLKNANILEKSNTGSITYLDSPCMSDHNVCFDTKGEDCYFSYFIHYNGSYGYMTAIYFRSSNNKTIDDITIQHMLIEFPSGDPGAGISIVLPEHYAKESLGTASLFMAVEKTLTGNLILNKEQEINHVLAVSTFSLSIPDSYEGENYTANLSKKNYISVGFTEEDINEDFNDTYVSYTYNVKLK